MDARDLFKQLTCGVNFAATKTDRKRAHGDSPKKPPAIAIKTEKIESDEDIDDDAAFEFDADDVITEQDDAEADANIFGNILADNLRAKRKKSQPSADKLKLLGQQQVNEVRNRHALHVSGASAASAPPPIETFDAMAAELALGDQLMSNVAECGYRTPTAIQMQAIPAMCAGHSLLACAPTGSGKTATFLLPIVRQLREPRPLGFRALILCPTRELAKQTQRECLRLVDGIGLRVHTLSKTNQAEQRYGQKSNGQFDVLVTTPNRVCHLLGQQPPQLCLANVEWLVLDEADKLFEEGAKSFREQFDRIAAACVHAQRRVALFSATWTVPVARWLRRNEKRALTVTVGQRNSATALVDQRLQFVGSESGKLLALRELMRTGFRPPVLVFVDTKDRAEQLYRELIYDGVNVDMIHADRTQQQRDAVVKAFREGKVWVLICTELIGRGIDFKGVNLVVNYDFPPSPIAYIHRIGRTGRAGRKGEAITYFTQTDTVHLKPIARIVRNSGCEVPAFMLSMKEHSKRSLKKLQREAKPREAISVRAAKRTPKGQQAKGPRVPTSDGIMRKVKKVPKQQQKRSKSSKKTKEDDYFTQAVPKKRAKKSE